MTKETSIYFHIFDFLDTHCLSKSNSLTVLGVDFNQWSPHVSTSLEILGLLSKNGCTSIYSQKKFGFFPEFGKPYFGRGFAPNKKFLDEIEVKEIAYKNSGFDEEILTPYERKKMQCDLMGIKDHHQLGELSYKQFDYGYAILSTIASTYGLGEIPSSLIHKLGSLLLDEYIDSANFVHSTIVNMKVDCLIVYNGRFINERAAWRSAEGLGIPVLFHEASKDFSYCISNYSPHSRTGYRKLAEEMTTNMSTLVITDEAREWYEGRINGLNPDSSHFQKKWKKGYKSAESGVHEKKRISIFTTSDDEYIGLSNEWDLPEKRTQKEWLEIIVRLAVFYNYEVILRLHPNLATKSRRLRKEWLLLRKIMGLKVIDFNDAVNSYSLVKYSDLVITCGSTIAMEAGYLGKPVLSVGTGIYDLLGAITKVQNLAEIERILKVGEFQDLLPVRQKIELYGYVEKNKFMQPSIVVKNKKIRNIISPTTSLANRIFSKVYRRCRFLWFSVV